MIMSTKKRKSIIEGNKSIISSGAASSSPTRRPSVFERLGPGSSSLSSNKLQTRKSFESKHRSHEKPSASTGCHIRDSGGAAESTSHHVPSKKIKNRSRSREKKEQVSDVRSKISLRQTESSDYKSKELTALSPSPKRSIQAESRRREPETKIRSQVAVVTNRTANSKLNEKGIAQSAEDWKSDRSHLDYQEEFILEKKRQQLQRELELEMQKERLLKTHHDNVIPEKRVSSSASSSTSSVVSSSSSSSSSSTSSSSSSEGEDSSSSSSVSCSRGKSKFTSKRSSKIVSSLSGSNSEADVVRAKKGNIEIKSKKDSHAAKVKSNLDHKDLLRRSQVIGQDKKKKNTSRDIGTKVKRTTVATSAHLTTDISSSSIGKHKSSYHSSNLQSKNSEKSKKMSVGNSSSYKDAISSEPFSKFREHSPSPSSAQIAPNRSMKMTFSKTPVPVKKKHNVDDELIKAKEMVSSSRLKASSDSQRSKQRAPSVEDSRNRNKAGSPKSDVSHGRRSSPHAVRAGDNHSFNRSGPGEKRSGRHPSTPPPLPTRSPPLSRSNDFEKVKVNRDRRQPNFNDPVFKSDFNRKNLKDAKDSPKESFSSIKNVSRGRDEQKERLHLPESNFAHSRNDIDRGRDNSRHRMVDIEASERSRFNDSRGPHSPPRRDRNNGKKSDRSSHQQSSRDGIIDRLRDLSRTSVDLADYRGRRESAGRSTSEIASEPRNLPDDRSGKVIVDRDRRGRLLAEEPRYGTPEMSDHRSRPLSPPPGKYHSRNVTPPARPASPPPRHWSRDHPNTRDADIPYSSDRRKGTPPLSHSHYDMRNYNDDYDYGRSDHRTHDHANQRRDNYHPFPPSESLDIYDRDVPRGRQDYGHSDQRRNDYTQSNRWEDNREGRAKGVSDHDRLKDDKWNEEDLATKRKRTRDDPLEKLPLAKRRRGLTPPSMDNQRSGRGGPPIDSGRQLDNRGRKSSTNRGNSSRLPILTEVSRSSKELTGGQQPDIQDSGRSKRREESIKDIGIDTRSSRIDDSKRKRPRTPDSNTKPPSKLRKTSPCQTVRDDKAEEKSFSKDSKLEKDNSEKEVDKEEIKPNLFTNDVPASPAIQTAESFSDWSDDSLDLLNQEENIEDAAVASSEKAENIAVADVNIAISDDKDNSVATNEEKVDIEIQKKSEDSTLLLPKDNQGRRKPKSEGGDDSRGSFDDSSSRERKSRDRHRGESTVISQPSKSTSRHASLERSRRRHQEIESERPRSKANTPRPRTPVSRPRTPSPPKNSLEPIASEIIVKQQSKSIENLTLSIVSETVVSPAPPPDEKTVGPLDDYEYDPISDDELEAMIEESDEKDTVSEKLEKPAATDILEVDWASLARDKAAPKVEPRKQSIFKSFSAAKLLYEIGVSAKYAGPALMERIENMISAKLNKTGNQDANQECENISSGIVFEDKIAAFHAVAVASKKERETLLDDIGPFRQALCARKDLQIRRKLGRSQIKDPSTISLHNVELDAFKLSLQLFRQRRNAAGLK